MSHFERAFYELTPQKRDREAALEFDQAIAQFELEVKQQPSSAVAHQYLGPHLFAPEGLPEVRQHYDRLSEIEPLNVDACVLAAWRTVKRASSSRPGCGSPRRGNERRTRWRSPASLSTWRKLDKLNR